MILIDVNDKIMSSPYSIDSDFFDTLRNYFEKGIETDVTAVKAGDSNLPEFQKLLEFAAKNLQKYVDVKEFSLLMHIICFFKEFKSYMSY